MFVLLVGPYLCLEPGDNIGTAVNISLSDEIVSLADSLMALSVTEKIPSVNRTSAICSGPGL